MKSMLIGQRIIKWATRIAIIFGVIYVLAVIDKSLSRQPQCPIEEHSFQGEKFDVELCLNLHDNSQRIGIFVYAKNGGLLAWRGATFARESPLNYLAIEDTMIRYSDDISDLSSASIPEDCVLNMPPTWVDWLEARLPGGIPGVNHCGTVSDEISAKARQSWRNRVKADREKRSALNSEPARVTASAAPR
jgi:hypothetical protein